MAIIKLTRELFRELDILVRTEAGCVLSVYDWMGGKSCFGYFNPWPEGVYKTLDVTDAPGCCRELCFIKVANQIDTEHFAKEPRPEMDFAAVPGNLIYKFIVFHEIHHRLFGLTEFQLFSLGIPVGEEMERLRFCLEAHADRYGWNRLFPWHPFPERPDKNGASKLIRETMDSHRSLFRTQPREIRPISTHPNEMVPVDHVKKGIPWAIFE